MNYIFKALCNGVEVYIKVHNLNDFFHANSEDDIVYYTSDFSTGFTSKKNFELLELVNHYPKR